MSFLYFNNSPQPENIQVIFMYDSEKYQILIFEKQMFQDIAWNILLSV